MKRVLVIISIILSTGCVTSLTVGGEKVRITSNPEVVRPCKYVAEVKGVESTYGGENGQVLAEENAIRRLKNNAAAAGANTVFITTSSTSTSGSVARGEAYRCPD